MDPALNAAPTTHALTQKEEDLIQTLMSDKQAFNEFVYTPLEKAMEELLNRQENTKIDACLSKLLPQGVPKEMCGKRKAVLCRSIATPNFEITMFIERTRGLKNLESLILEYTADKYVGLSDIKKALGRICLLQRGTDGSIIISCAVIMDLYKNNGKSFNSILTSWGEDIVQFHHKLFFKAFPAMKGSVHDMSDWIQQMGRSTPHFYKEILSLFLKNGLLFENFLWTKKDTDFAEKVLLPAILLLEKMSGHKPLIIALNPYATEESLVWNFYSPEKKFVNILPKLYHKFDTMNLAWRSFRK